MDDALLRLRAAARGGDRGAIHRLVRQLQRAGPPSRELELAAYVLEVDAGSLGPATLLPRKSTLPGAPFELDCSLRSTRHGLELTWRDPARASAWGELDASYAGIPREELERLLSATVQIGVRHLVLDLRHVHGLTSAGLGRIAKLKDELERGGGSLGLLLSERVSSVTQMLGLAEFLGVLEDPGAANAQLDAAPLAVAPERGSGPWLAGILRWGARRAEQAALCLAAHSEPALYPVFDAVCQAPVDRELEPLPTPPRLSARGRVHWACAERLRYDSCWPDELPSLEGAELDALVAEWIPRLLAAPPR